MVGRESSERRWAYVRVEGEVERESRVSWRSFCSCSSESFGRFGVSEEEGSAQVHCAKKTFGLTRVFRPCPPSKDMQEGQVRRKVV